MKRTITISKARSNLSDLSKQLAKPSKRAGVTVTRKGKPVMAILNWEYYESLLETMEILGDKELMKSIRQSMAELDAGKGIPWEEAKKDLM